jgi:hypothetical protein
MKKKVIQPKTFKLIKKFKKTNPILYYYLTRGENDG